MTIPKVIAKVVRFAAGSPRSSSAVSPTLDSSDTKVCLTDYTYIADLTPHAAEPLLQRFKREGIRFEIGCDLSPPAESAVNGGSYAERRTISIFVHREDVAKAGVISEAPDALS